MAEDATGIIGYAFSIIEDHSAEKNIIPRKTLYIDDLCTDYTSRERSVGKLLFDAVKSLAADEGCYNITLNV